MTRTFWAPGRVNLIGEHTDYSGGLVLPAALELGIRLDCVAASRIQLESDAAEGAVELAADGSGETAGWGRYVAAVAAELSALGRPPVGIAGRLSSTLPAGAGLSSSAALEVVVALALCAVADFAVEPLALADACRRAEERAAGVPCGIMDQAASLLGVAGHALLLDTATLEHRAIPLPSELVLAIFDSGIRRRLEESGYAERRREVEQGHPRRRRHVVSENERVREAAALLTATPLDTARLGEVFRAGHESLRDDFEVSTPELDLLVDLAYEHGAVAARMTGAGFGGSIVALVDTARADAVVAAVSADYQARTGRAATAHVGRPAHGAREL